MWYRMLPCATYDTALHGLATQSRCVLTTVLEAHKHCQSPLRLPALSEPPPACLPCPVRAPSTLSCGISARANPALLNTNTNTTQPQHTQHTQQQQQQQRQTKAPLHHRNSRHYGKLDTLVLCHAVWGSKPNQPTARRRKNAPLGANQL